MKKLILLTTALAVALNAGMIKENELEKLQKQKQKSSLEAELTKDSWIAPVTLEANITKSKGIDGNKSTSKKAYLNLNQDIFRSGGIYYTIEKGEVSQRLSSEQFNKDLSSLKVELFKTVLNLRVLDLQIQKQDFLIKNKTLEIEKKQEQYLNSLIDIEELDQAVIDKNDLLNGIEDLKTSKYEQEKNLKKYTNLPYQEIDVRKLKVLPLKEYLDENQNLVIQRLNSQISKYDQKIKSSSYLPKISLFSQVGYEDSDASKMSDDYYNYGIKLSIPLDYNMNKNKEIARVNYLLSKLEESIKKDDEEQKHKAILKKLKSYDRKIDNAKLSINKYQSIYAQTNELYESLLKTKQDLQTIENRLNSSRLDIKIFSLQKDIQVYELYKSLIKI